MQVLSVQTKQTYIVSQNHAQFPDVVLCVNGAQPVDGKTKKVLSHISFATV